MVRKAVFAALLLTACFTAAAQDLLVRITVPPGEAAKGPLQSRVRLLSELGDGGLALLETQEAEDLRAGGTQVLVLDQEPAAWDYWLVKLRPDSCLADLRAAGDVLHTEENWVLLRTPPGLRPARLQEGQFFVTPLPREPMAPPVSPLGPSSLAGRPAGPEHADPLVQKVVAGVSTAGIDAAWGALAPANGTPAPTRYTTDSGCGDDATFCYNFMAAQDLPVAYDDWGGTSRAPNVIGTQTGALTPERVYIVMGHLDDMPSTGYAPGADDNASGTVVVLESARALSCYAFKSTVKYLAVTGEETGLEGSGAYADAAKARGEDIRGVLNMDMPGWAGDGAPASGEDLDLNYNSSSQDLGLFYAQCATDYATGLPVKAILCPSFTASDHYRFWARGYKAVCGITDNEGDCGHQGHYPYYHTSSDTVANCGDRTFFHRVVSTTVAALAELAEPFKITFDAAAYTCGATATVIVGDRDLNANPSSRETVAVDVWSGAEPGAEALVLQEDGLDSMVFRGTLALTSAPAAHGDGAVSVGDGDTLSARYTDALDCDGATAVDYTAQAAVSPSLFVGLGAVVNPAGEPCALALTWSPPACREPAGYAVYRSTDPGFTPGPANRIATGVRGTSYRDADGLAPGTSYAYIVREQNGATWTEDSNTVVRTGVPTGVYVDGAWQAGAEPGGASPEFAAPWTVSPAHPHGGTASYYSGYAHSSCSALSTPPLTVTSGATLSYYTMWSIQSAKDGGQVQITSDGGATWSTLTPSPTYPGTLSVTGNACGWPGTTPVYTGNSAGYPGTWVLATVPIPASYDGRTVQIRWAFSTNQILTGTGVDPGWYIDDIVLTHVLVPGPCATLARPGETSPGGSLADALRWTSPSSLAWNGTSGATGYALLRGTPDQLSALLTPAEDHCVAWTGAGTGWTSGDLPAPGSFLWYLVLGTNAAGDGAPGSATAGPRTVNGSGPCP